MNDYPGDAAFMYSIKKEGIRKNVSRDEIKFAGGLG